MNINNLLRKLNQKGFEAYVYHDVGHSKYIKFKVNLGGNLRIADHPQRSRYAYKWSLRKDLDKPDIRLKKGKVCFYYPWNMIDNMIAQMVKERDKQIILSAPQPLVSKLLDEI